MLQKITAPIHRSTAYDFNVLLDHGALASRKGMRMYGSTTQDDEHLGVKEHEILVRRKYRDNVYGNGRLQVFSSLNNVMVSPELIEELQKINPGRWRNAETVLKDRLGGKGNWDEDTHSAELSMAMHRLYEYVGVAITPQDYVHKHSRQESQGFACTRGGLNTIINNGESKIQAGQKIYISFRLQNHLTDKEFQNPSHHAAGIPHSKALVTLDNKDNSQDGLTDRVLQQMHEICRHEDQRDIYDDKWYPLQDNTPKPDIANMPLAELCCNTPRRRRGSMGVPVGKRMKLIVLLPNFQHNMDNGFNVSFKETRSNEEYLNTSARTPEARDTIVYWQDNIIFDGNRFRNIKVFNAANPNGVNPDGRQLMRFINPSGDPDPGVYTTHIDNRGDVDPLLGKSPAFGSSLAYMLQQVIDPVDQKPLPKSHFAHLLRRTVEVAIKAHEMQRRDPIGVAVSGARPGEPFDILLHG